MPDAEELPEAVRQFAYLHATRLRDADFEYDFGRLCEAIKPICGNLDFRQRQRRKLFIGVGFAIAVLVAIFTLGLQRILNGSIGNDDGELGELRQRLTLMENQAKTLRSELLGL